MTDYSKNLTNAINRAYILCQESRNEFLTPEHMLKAILFYPQMLHALVFSVEDADQASELQTALDEYLSELEQVPENIDYVIESSVEMQHIFMITEAMAKESGVTVVDIPHLVNAMLICSDTCVASQLLHDAIGGDTGSFMRLLIDSFDENYGKEKMDSYNESADSEENGMPGTATSADWHDFVVCVNDNLESRNPLVGREKELEHTIRVLCRKDKNNPLHVGEPGVGKTALVYGLAAMINEDRVPPRLRGCRIYQLDIASLLAGTQFRGDFEKRLKTIMEGIASEPGAIVYIDEIHNLVGAGANGNSSMDASNMLKPYLESGSIRFIGSTTYEEYNRYFARSKGLVRRFLQIDIKEPDVEEAIDIIRQLKPNYENFHNVEYDDDALEHAVRTSAKYISDRFLPDKAIDIIDEAGAYRELHPDSNTPGRVDVALIDSILSGVCRIEAQALKADSSENLENLRPAIKSAIYGQDEAVDAVTDAILMARAGLTDEGKPLASLLFVGPTGVGKTEVARVLASSLGVELVRFDMSEYAEKHTVAKLIGSPAGYVGYEDGGLLTDAIRRSPNCVLLLDEIEKAHSDIYNILLQVMDYARLTDNKGRHADFRNVVLIMTSNAGAQHASKARVGFESHITAGQAMLAQVKRTFKPEFINRLSATVVFRDMDMHMASLILDKNLRRLSEKLKDKNVELFLSDEAREHLLHTGFTREYGARELDRVISRDLKPLLMREILFGSLTEGGTAFVGFSDGKLTISDKSESAQ